MENLIKIYIIYSLYKRLSYYHKILIKKNERTLAIGDNLRTDIKGANNLNLDSIFITDGIHRSELGKIEELENLLNNYGVKTNFFQNRLVW